MTTNLTKFCFQFSHDSSVLTQSLHINLNNFHHQFITRVTNSLLAMDELPLEVLFILFGNLDNVSELASCDRLSRTYHDIFHRYGSHLLLSVGRTQFPGFENLLLLVRARELQVWGLNLCSFDLASKRYINVPTKSMLNILSAAVGTGVTGKGSGWKEEAKQIKELYLLGIALYASSSKHHSFSVSDQRDHAAFKSDVKHGGIERFLIGFYRSMIFTTLFGQGIFTAPILETTHGDEPRRNVSSVGNLDDY